MKDGDVNKFTFAGFQKLARSPMRTKPRSELTDRKKLMQDLDKACSDWCLSLKKCECCGGLGWDKLETHHISHRRHLINRWDKDNLRCLCWVCHDDLQNRKDRENFVFGADVCEELRSRENQICKFTIEELEEKLSEVKSWPRRDA